tara:strand:- start:255 stop:410 length:156 start_codon:yes stop_codon:yes gene_type:complete
MTISESIENTFPYNAYMRYQMAFEKKVKSEVKGVFKVFTFSDGSTYTHFNG